MLEQQQKFIIRSNRRRIDWGDLKNNNQIEEETENPNKNKLHEQVNALRA